MDFGSVFPTIMMGRDDGIANVVQTAHITVDQEMKRQELGAEHSPQRPTRRCIYRHGNAFACRLPQEAALRSLLSAVQEMGTGMKGEGN